MTTILYVGWNYQEQVKAAKTIANVLVRFEQPYTMSDKEIVLDGFTCYFTNINKPIESFYGLEVDEIIYSSRVSDLLYKFEIIKRAKTSTS